MIDRDRINTISRANWGNTSMESEKFRSELKNVFNER